MNMLFCYCYFVFPSQVNSLVLAPKLLMQAGGSRGRWELVIARYSQ